jgi:uncharacterized protein (TIGR03546 family)
MNVHTRGILALILVLNVSFGGALLGWALFAPFGFLLDPVFDRVGRQLLLDTPSLQPMWTSWFNAPVIPYTNFNNSIVLGSFIVWLALSLPIFFAARYGVSRYRATLGERVRRSRFYNAVTASKAYNVYTWFRPD